MFRSAHGLHRDQSESRNGADRSAISDTSRNDGVFWAGETIQASSLLSTICLCITSDLDGYEDFVQGVKNEIAQLRYDNDMFHDMFVH